MNWKAFWKGVERTALVLAIPTFLLYLFEIFITPQITSKVVEVVTTSTFSLADLNRVDTSGLDIHLIVDGEEAENATIIEFSVTNKGTEPITRADFDTPISFTTAPGSSIVGTKILSTRPSDLDVYLTKISENKQSLEPLLLNAGDKFIVRLIVINDISAGKSLKVAGKVKGGIIEQETLIELSTADPTLPHYQIGPFSVSSEVITLITGLVLGLISLLASRVIMSNNLRSRPLWIKRKKVNEDNKHNGEEDH